jgi:DNA-binding SARP family transcriptional activator
VGTRTDDSAVYVNLEADGAAGVVGPDPAAVDAVLTGAARALAGAPWAEQTQMIVPPRFASAVEGLERVDVLGEPSQLLDYIAGYADRIAADLPTGATVASTRRDGTVEAVGVVALVGFTPADLPDALLHAATHPTRPVVAVLAGPVEGGVTWRLDGEVLQLPGVGPVATSPRVHGTDVAAEGRLLAQAVSPGEAAPDDPQLVGLAADSPPDAADGRPDTIRVNLLGPVELHAPGRPKRESVRELVLYLALHRRPRQDTVIYARLFPDSEFSRDVLRSRMTEVRRVLAGALVHVDHSWGVTEDVTTDWQHFQALAAGSPEQQRAALALVRGQPFQGYDAEWVYAEGHDRVIEAAIVDLALSVAEHALEHGDDRFATDAVEAGLRASPYDERLYQIGMRSAAARGATGEVRGYMRALKRLLDVDLEPDDHIQPETERIYRELTSTDRRAAG